MPSHPLLLADVAPAPVSSPITGIVIAAVLLVIVALIVLSRRKKKPEEPALPPAGQRPLTPADLAVQRAEADLARVKAEREAAEAKAKAEQDERRAKEETARQKAEAEAKVRAEVEAKAAELKRQATEAATDEERKKAREEAAKLEAEAARRRKLETEAERRAEYEAKKAQEAVDKVQRRAGDEAAKLQAVEEAKKAAEEAAKVELAKQRRIEAESGRTLAEGLQKTRGGFVARLAQLVGAAPTLDEKFIGELEEILFTADIGVRTADRLVNLVRDKLKRKELANPERVKSAIKDEIERILTIEGTFTQGGMPTHTGSGPQVVMIVGVNGSGKTTTLGKLSFKERVNGRNVLLGAGDTFRAAAAEQLDVWAGRAEVEIVKGPPDSDPAAVCFEAVKRAVDEKRDLCLLDTAGRLHTKVGLMDELKKVKRVLEKAQAGAPHETWLVVDGTTGQNGLEQAKQFHEALGLTGIVLTKLDGTAKGGIVIGICDQLKVPVRYVGVGEKIGDLRPFSPKEFADALFAEA